TIAKIHRPWSVLHPYNASFPAVTDQAHHEVGYREAAKYDLDQDQGQPHVKGYRDQCP
ncbi:hypothetical protein A2U01_0027114, partial [Trifolium medium]|nr:hypothetical protein [Trifolium medium]